MVPDRIENPGADALAAAEQRLRAGESIIVQFSDARHYTPDLLRQVDSLCAGAGERLEVRFYGGRVSASFDCRTLEQIPRVANLSIDCLERAENIAALAELGALRRLCLGIFGLADDQVLRFPNLKSLRALELRETRTRAIDLSFLRGFSNLEDFAVSGHTRGLAAIKDLQSLRTLALGQIGKRASLDFVSEIPHLSSLSVGLGGRASLAEIEAPELETLWVSRVQGLLELGDLSRFQKLTSLLVQDQRRLEHLRFSSRGSKLENLRILNCKAFRELTGLEALSRLSELRVHATALDLDALLARALPPSLKTFAFYTDREREDRRIRAILDARGYLEF